MCFPIKDFLSVPFSLQMCRSAQFLRNKINKVDFCCHMLVLLTSCERICWTFMFTCLWHLCHGQDGDVGGDCVHNRNVAYWISDQFISVIYQQDRHEGARWIFSPFRWKIQNCFSLGCLLSLCSAQSVLYITLLLSVCLFSARGAHHPAMTMK